MIQESRNIEQKIISGVKKFAKDIIGDIIIDKSTQQQQIIQSSDNMDRGHEEKDLWKSLKSMKVEVTDITSLIEKANNFSTEKYGNPYFWIFITILLFFTIFLVCKIVPKILRDMKEKQKKKRIKSRITGGNAKLLSKKDKKYMKMFD